jgi:hypothetical protein
MLNRNCKRMIISHWWLKYGIWLDVNCIINNEILEKLRSVNNNTNK